MRDMFLPFDAVHSPRLSDSRLEHPANIDEKSVTEDTSQPDRSSVVRDDRFWNIPERSVAPAAFTPSR